MTKTFVNQSFGVDDIRRIREEADMRHQGMTQGEIAHAIHEGAQVCHQIMGKLKVGKKRNPVHGNAGSA